MDPDLAVASGQLAKLAFGIIAVYLILRRPVRLALSFLKRRSPAPSDTESLPSAAPQTGQLETDFISIVREIGGEKAAIIMEYSKEAQDAYRETVSMGPDLRTQFLRRLDEAGLEGMEACLNELRQEHLRRHSLYENEAANRGYQEAVAISTAAADEYKKVIEALGDAADIDPILERLRAKYVDKHTPRYTRNNTDEVSGSPSHHDKSVVNPKELRQEIEALKSKA
ncbi:MAG: hypothetical protein HOH43_02535 [Candidatus Latescibacteria bacterium]|jgi:hypothetical protein|nr:hypothetical protein [Candidatus Latescibacterota bacterium]